MAYRGAKRLSGPFTAAAITKNISIALSGRLLPIMYVLPST